MNRGFEIHDNYKGEKINLPRRRTAKSAGYDIESAQDILIPKNKIVIVHTGLKVSIEFDEVLLIYIRSSMAYKNQISLANGVGVIDADYEGEIMIPLLNLGEEDFMITKGMRIAQGIIQKYMTVEGDEVGVGEKRQGGFGSTGL